MKKSVMTGNYELYYGAGLIEKSHGLGLAPELRPQELEAQLKQKLPALTPKDEQEAYLIKLLLDYRAEETYDDQMPELFALGRA
jgi:hypothetical protein